MRGNLVGRGKYEDGAAVAALQQRGPGTGVLKGLDGAAEAAGQGAISTLHWLVRRLRFSNTSGVLPSGIVSVTSKRGLFVPCASASSAASYSWRVKNALVTSFTSLLSIAKLLNVSGRVHRPSSRIVPRLRSCCTACAIKPGMPTHSNTISALPPSARRQRR